MRRKKTMTETDSGTPSHIVVLLLNNAFIVTANAKTRIPRDISTLPQKKNFWIMLSLSFDWLDFTELPVILAKKI
jgi:hypothetical protein